MVELIAAVDGGHLEALYIRLYGAGVAVLKDRYNTCIVQEDLLCLRGQFCLFYRIDLQNCLFYQLIILWITPDTIVSLAAGHHGLHHIGWKYICLPCNAEDIIA